MTIWEKEGYYIRTEKQFLDVESIHHFLSEESYWARGISFESVTKAIDHSSICFGLYHGNPEKEKVKQVGFVRAVTDFVRFAYIMDVFVVDEYRGKGLSKWLMEVSLEQSSLNDVKKIVLCTHDAHGLYSQYGFNALEKPEIFMEKKKI